MTGARHDQEKRDHPERVHAAPGGFVVPVRRGLPVWQGTRRGAGKCPSDYDWTIEVPWTVIAMGASGLVAGPFTTEPLAALNLLP